LKSYRYYKDSYGKEIWNSKALTLIYKKIEGEDDKWYRYFRLPKKWVSIHTPYSEYLKEITASEAFVEIL